jgi:hypothetical protein
MLSEQEIREIYLNYIQIHPQFKNYLNLDNFPHIIYHVFEDWMPSHLNALFIAESPPWKEVKNYFYDPSSENSLTRHLFSLLKISNGTKLEKLVDFRDRGYLLIDTIWCIFDKGKHPIPQSLISWSAQQILFIEIEQLKPTKILAMGNTAFHGMREIPSYSSDLKKHATLKTIAGKSIRIKNGMECIFTPYPNDRNRQYQTLIDSGFMKIREI